MHWAGWIWTHPRYPACGTNRREAERGGTKQASAATHMYGCFDANLLNGRLEILDAFPCIVDTASQLLHLGDLLLHDL